MAFTVFHKNDYPVSAWSGGTTTQLYIYPPESDYAARNFLFRISSATVDCETSQFTALPGVSRIILPLRGTLLLRHKGHGNKFLREFEQDRFDGGWETVSVGRAADFNLMTRSGAVGDVAVYVLEPNDSICLTNSCESILTVYVAQGACICSAKEWTTALENAALAVTQDADTLSLTNRSANCCRLVCATIQLTSTAR